MRAALQEGERAPADVARADNAYREEAAVCTHTVQQGLSPAAAAVRETSGGTPGAVSTCYRRAEVRAGCYSEILDLDRGGDAGVVFILVRRGCVAGVFTNLSVSGLIHSRYTTDTVFVRRC